MTVERAGPAAIRSSLVASIALLGLVAAAASRGDALPFLAAGDPRVRHLLEMAADDSDGTMLETTWPVPTLELPAEQRSVLHSIQRPGTSADAGWFISGTVHPDQIRTFDDTPRERAEAGVQSGWAAGDYAGGVLSLGVAAHPQDGMHLRFDDSYLAWRLGNWWLSAGEQQRWWGPGWDGSLILSNNARPMPSVSIDRANSEPFHTPLLHWLGPWRLTTFLARAEYQSQEFPHPLFWGLRATARPLRDIEISLSRTAQWCRVDVCSVHTFGDVLLGKNNAGVNLAAAEQAGNQELAWDLRWRLGAWPVALYYQENGETADQKTPLLPRPRQTTDLIGLEAWSRTAGGGSWRGFLEWVGTTCGEISTAASDQPNYNCAYAPGITWGYYYRDRVIGDSIQGDGRMLTLGGLYLDTGERTWELRLRKGILNRAGLSVLNTLSPVRANTWSIDAQLSAKWQNVTISAGAGAYSVDPTGGSTHTTGRVYLNLSAPW